MPCIKFSEMNGVEPDPGRLRARSIPRPLSGEIVAQETDPTSSSHPSGRAPPPLGAPWRMELLGWLRACQAGQVVNHFRTRKAGALLAYLAYYRHRSHPREVLIELLWPGCDPLQGRTRLSTELTSLRRQLEPSGVPRGTVVVTDHSGVQLNPAACSLDVEQFELTLRAATRMSSGTERGRQLTTAIELYQGELLPGYFEDWVVPERQRMAEIHLQGLGQLIGHLEQAGDVTQALHWAWHAAMADPLQEEAYGHLMRLLSASGRPEAAMRQYEALTERLVEALGVIPEREIRDLAGEIEKAPGKNSASLQKTQALVWRGQVAVAEAQALRQQLAAHVADGRELRQQLAVQKAEGRELRQQLAQANQQLRDTDSN
jgi:DNA-binding SARP family transcriptional activator